MFQPMVSLPLSPFIVITKTKDIRKNSLDLECGMHLLEDTRALEKRCVRVSGEHRQVTCGRVATLVEAVDACSKLSRTSNDAPHTGDTRDPFGNPWLLSFTSHNQFYLRPGGAGQNVSRIQRTGIGCTLGRVVQPLSSCAMPSRSIAPTIHRQGRMALNTRILTLYFIFP